MVYNRLVELFTPVLHLAAHAQFEQYHVLHWSPAHYSAQCSASAVQ